MDEIKPCPECGGLRVEIDRWPHSQNFECQTCGFLTVYYDHSPEHAIAAWNRVARPAKEKT